MPIQHLLHSTCFSHSDKENRVCSPKGEIQKFLYDCKGSLTCLALHAFLGQSHMQSAATHIQVRSQLAPGLSNADLVLQLRPSVCVQYRFFQVACALTNSFVNSQAKDRLISSVFLIVPGVLVTTFWYSAPLQITFLSFNDFQFLHLSKEKVSKQRSVGQFKREEIN